MNDTVFGIIFASVAGIMVFISFDELLPAAREYGEHHLSIYGLISGMIVMSISLLLFIWKYRDTTWIFSLYNSSLDKGGY